MLILIFNTPFDETAFNTVVKVMRGILKSTFILGLKLHTSTLIASFICTVMSTVGESLLQICSPYILVAIET